MPVAAVERLDVAEVGRVDGAEGVGVDRPAGLVLGVAVAVLFQQAVEELEELAGGPQVAEGVLEGVVGDRLVDELAEPRAGRRPFSEGRRRGGGRWRGRTATGPVQRRGLIMFSLSGRALS